MPIEIKNQSTSGIFRTVQDQFLLNLLGLYPDVEVTAAADGTSADYARPGITQPSINVLGTGLTAAAGAFTGGTISGFLPFDFSTGQPFATFTGFDLSAADFQAEIEALLLGTGTPGENAEALRISLFDNQRQNITGAGGLDLLRGGNKKDVLKGKNGDDTFILTPGNDIVKGGDGNDHASFVEISSLGAVSFDMKSGLATFEDGTVQTLTKLEGVIQGTVAGDITGTGAANSFLGSGANDTLRGKGGDDTISGQGGNDKLFGNDGDDYVTGGDGKDTIKGGNGDDELFGEAGKDTIEGNDGKDYIDGGDNADVLKGGKKKDTVLGGAGNDSIDGGEGNDRLEGNAGADTMEGAQGNDTVKGGDGKDRLFG